MAEDRLGSLMVRTGAFLFRTRNYVFPIVMIGLLILFPVRPEDSSEAADAALHLLGIAFVLAGAGLRATVLGFVFVERGGRNRRIHAERLLVRGMFAHCRNPLYLGNLLIVLGLLVNHNNFWAYLLVGGFFLFAYRAMIAAEEEYLLGRFGRDYLDYCIRAPRWRVRLKGLRRTFAMGRFEWRRVLAVEYASIALWTAMVLADLGADAAMEEPFPASLHELVPIAFGIVAAGAMALWVRSLKKSGRLAGPV